MSGSTSTPLRGEPADEIGDVALEQRERVGTFLGIDGLREVDEHERVVPHQHVVRREVAVHYSRVRHHVELIDGRLAQRRESLDAARARRRGAAPSDRRRRCTRASPRCPSAAPDTAPTRRPTTADRASPNSVPAHKYARNSMPRSVPLATARSMRRSPVFRPRGIGSRHGTFAPPACGSASPRATDDARPARAPRGTPPPPCPS